MSGTDNGLDSDMKRARVAIGRIAGADPQFVRATYGYTDKNCMAVYRKNDLTHVYWDVVSGDDARPADHNRVCAALQAATQDLAAGDIELIYLFHDISEVTAKHLPEFIDVIAASVRANGLEPEYIADRPQAEATMRKKARAGTDNPCPADSMG
jgi:peptidoglycan/xylan/chitin deacetylase (PgdA/CDA1 family)